MSHHRPLTVYAHVHEAQARRLYEELLELSQEYHIANLDSLYFKIKDANKRSAERCRYWSKIAQMLQPFPTWIGFTLGYWQENIIYGPLKALGQSLAADGTLSSGSPLVTPEELPTHIRMHRTIHGRYGWRRTQ